VVEHGQLAEDLSRAELRERDHPPVLVLAHDADGASLDDVAGVAAVPLAEDHLPAVVAARDGHLCHLLQLPWAEAGEDLHLR
jgi:hypothetical protein